ncbi:AEC family transporter [Sphingobacterium sp. N143]|uniref:AEC family transporter n=1 Tax=Sphingobacterium sp. N143 TaxID=2746727 RepID=UPI00257574A1|nr:AEC family transporter [Sphingobacterium sp. N143]MDM1294061.1 AEC family transporter [Sphingobacterium sp. N143]
MVNFIMIVLCIAAGMLLRRTNLIHAEAHKGINTWILYFALPAVSFKYLPKIEWSSQLLFPIFSAVLVWAGSWLFMELYCKRKSYKQRSRSSLELAAGYSNTSFIGFPLIMAYFGEEQLPIAIICDQTTFILLSTVGIINALKANLHEGESISVRFMFGKLISFPPLIGCILALGLSPFVDLSMAEPFFDKLVATVGPLALFSIGLQLKFNGWRQQAAQISTAMIYKLILAPALVLLFALLLGVKGPAARISIFEAAMPTLVTSGIIAEQYHLNTKLVNLVIGFSIIIGLLTTACWEFVIRMLIG